MIPLLVALATAADIAPPGPPPPPCACPDPATERTCRSRLGHAPDCDVARDPAFHRACMRKLGFDAEHVYCPGAAPPAEAATPAVDVTPSPAAPTPAPPTSGWGCDATGGIGLLGGLIAAGLVRRRGR